LALGLGLRAVSDLVSDRGAVRDPRVGRFLSPAAGRGCP
jgi:hypothetical protein